MASSVPVMLVMFQAAGCAACAMRFGRAGLCISQHACCARFFQAELGEEIGIPTSLSPSPPADHNPLAPQTRARAQTFVRLTMAAACSLPQLSSSTAAPLPVLAAPRRSCSAPRRRCVALAAQAPELTQATIAPSRPAEQLGSNVVPVSPRELDGRSRCG